MSTYAAANFEYLYNFSNSNVSRPYNVDTYLYDYTADSTTFDNNLPLADYFLALQSAKLEYEQAADVDAAASDVSYDSDATSRRFFATSMNTLKKGTTNTCLPPAANNATRASAARDVFSTEEFNGDIERTDINVKVVESRNNVDIYATLGEVVNSMHSRISILGKSLQKATKSTSTLNDMFKSNKHTEFDMYLNEINTAIGVVYFKKLYAEIVESQKPTRVPFPGDNISEEEAMINDAVAEADRIRLSAIGNLQVINVPWKFDPLLQLVKRAAKKTLYTIIVNMPSFSASKIGKGVSSRKNMTPPSTAASYYYLFRTLMVQYLAIDKTLIYEDDNKIDLFTRKLVVDMFIKSCYPLIHYDMVDILMKRYIELGDFVNARFGLLAKSLFTFNMVNTIVSLVTSLTSGMTPDTPIVIHSSVSRDVANNILDYIKRNNYNGDGVSSDEKLKDIVTELHELSNSVVENSQYLEVIQNAIRQNQLAMRTLIDGNIAKRKEVAAKFTEFYILIAIILVTIVACGVLYFLEYHDIGAMVAGAVLVGIIVYKLVLLIIRFITKN